MPYLGLTGNGLLAGVTCSAGMGFILFGIHYLAFFFSKTTSDEI